VKERCLDRFIKLGLQQRVLREIKLSLEKCFKKRLRVLKDFQKHYNKKIVYSNHYSCKNCALNIFSLEFKKNIYQEKSPRKIVVKYS